MLRDLSVEESVFELDDRFVREREAGPRRGRLLLVLRLVN